MLAILGDFDPISNYKTASYLQVSSSTCYLKIKFRFVQEISSIFDQFTGFTKVGTKKRYFCKKKKKNLQIFFGGWGKKAEIPLEKLLSKTLGRNGEGLGV